VGMHALVEPEIRGEQMTQLIGHTGAITALAVSTDGLLLASASEDRSVLLWNLPNGTRNSELLHSAEVTAVAFAPTQGSGYTLLCGCGDGRGQLWRTSGVGKPNSMMLGQQHEGAIRAVAFSAMGLVAPPPATTSALPFGTAPRVNSFSGCMRKKGCPLIKEQLRACVSAPTDDSYRRDETTSSKCGNSARMKGRWSEPIPAEPARSHTWALAPTAGAFCSISAKRFASSIETAETV